MCHARVGGSCSNLPPMLEFRCGVAGWAPVGACTEGDRGCSLWRCRSGRHRCPPPPPYLRPRRYLRPRLLTHPHPQKQGQWSGAGGRAWHCFFLSCLLVHTAAHPLRPAQTPYTTRPRQSRITPPHPRRTRPPRTSFLSAFLTTMQCVHCSTCCRRGHHEVIPSFLPFLPNMHCSTCGSLAFFLSFFPPP